jgi:predicted DCC family thiol-disulfide oxidoreductase YuxK
MLQSSVVVLGWNLCPSTIPSVPLQGDHSCSSTACVRSAALEKVGAPGPGSLPDSIVFIDDEGVHVRSAAAIRIASKLGPPYSILRGALLVPRPIRDALYRFVARNRYRWFGRREVCMRPSPDLASRFLDADEVTL